MRMRNSVESNHHLHPTIKRLARWMYSVDLAYVKAALYGRHDASERCAVTRSQFSPDLAEQGFPG